MSDDAAERARRYRSAWNGWAADYAIRAPRAWAAQAIS